jgi:hypothetical protein
VGLRPRLDEPKAAADGLGIRGCSHRLTLALSFTFM